MASAMQNPRRIYIFSYVLKPDKFEGAFQKGNLGIFFILLDEHRLNQEEFINIEMF